MLAPHSRRRHPAWVGGWEVSPSFSRQRSLVAHEREGRHDDACNAEGVCDSEVAPILLKQHSEKCCAPDEDGEIRFGGAAASLVALGFCAGSALSCYLASCGYFSEKLNNKKLFGFQSLVVYVVQAAVAMLQMALDSKLDKHLGPEHAYGFRIIGSALLGGLTLLSLPFCQNPTALLVAGALISLFASTLLSSALKLSDAGATGSGMLVSLGATLGGLLPLVTAGPIGFGPGCTLEQALYFHAVACAVNHVLICLWAVEHESVVDQTQNANEELPTPRTLTARFIDTAYKTLGGNANSVVEESSWSWDSFLGFMVHTNSLCIFVNFVSGFAVLPLFTLAVPSAAQYLYLTKCLGDFLGRVAAIWHSRGCREAGQVPTYIRAFCVVLIIFRLAGSMLLGYEFITDAGYMPAKAWGCVVTIIFTMGGYATLLLDLDNQLAANHDDQLRVQRQHENIIAMFVGQLSGVIVGLSVLSSYEAAAQLELAQLKALASLTRSK